MLCSSFARKLIFIEPSFVDFTVATASSHQLSSIQFNWFLGGSLRNIHMLYSACVRREQIVPLNCRETDPKSIGQPSSLCALNYLFEALIRNDPVIHSLEY